MCPDPSTVTLRPITAADDAPLAAIIRANFKQYHLDIPGTAYFDPELDHLSVFYGASPAQRAYFVAVDERGTLLGGGGFAEFPALPACAELQKLYLADAAKGLGLGGRLIAQIEAQARVQGYETLYLETHSALDTAIRVYEHLGFSRIDKPACVQHATMDHFYLKPL